ncbi:MAG: valine--tRNA ligase [Candidatus Aminicenantes bacterium]|nr:valine--tRNA ligase [Candidatus Aminicenantes bacterium]
MDNLMQDMLIRWHRMLGDNTLWMPGTDHAGIATQAVVEKRLFELEGKTRHDIGREALVEKIWAWKDEYQQRIIQQLQSIGSSCDWKRVRFTMDAVCARAVREAVFRLFRDGLIYRGYRLVNWDAQLQTAVSDDEIVYEKIQGHFWHVRYPVVDPEPGEPEYVTVATTRPETMLGDTAVAVHPDPTGALEKLSELLPERIKNVPRKERAPLDDALREVEERKKSLLPLLLKLKKMAEQGRKVLLPLLEREIPLILDEWAKPELGTGCVKITPAHDPNDYDVWTRHKDEIDIINILNPDGSLNDNTGQYAGLDRLEARGKVVADLESQGLMETIEDREIEIGHSDRSKTPIEPYLSKQWFINMGDVEGGILCGRGTAKEFRASGLAQAAIDATDREWQSPSGLRLDFHPDHIRYGGTYRNWLGEKRDWCISRQLWWGHRIPIWHRGFEKEALEKTLKRLPKADKEELWIWIVDSEGGLFGLDKMPALKSGQHYDLLVCIRNEAAEDKYAGELENIGLKHDPDVLDTWFSSSLWPFSTLGWPDPETAEVDEGQRSLSSGENIQDCLSYYYPGSCLITGRDIITLWVARMVVVGLYLLGDVPFTDCFIHANIQDGKGERMSKSKGNGIDPEDIIEKYGADAMRYVLCDMQTGTQDIRLPVQAVSPYTGELVDLAHAKHGRTIFTYIDPSTGKEFDVLGTMPDIPMAKVISERFEIGKAFCTKLWNATRFALINLGEHNFTPLTPDKLEAEDHWILSRLSRTIVKVTAQLHAYNPSAAVGAAREFFWSELCDWYLEFIKPRFKNENSAPAARTVLSYAIDQVLRLFHPFVPFITEALWELLSAQCPVRGIANPLPPSDLLISVNWPESHPDWENKGIEKEFAVIQELIRSLRDIRSRYSIPPQQQIEALIKAEGRIAAVLLELKSLILHLGKISSLHVAPDMERPASAVVQILPDMELYLPGLIDPAKERERMAKQLDKLLNEAQKAEVRLGNKQFVERAPAEVVDAERKRLSELRTQIDLIDKNLKALK